jgi:hypothetical protein
MVGIQGQDSGSKLGSVFWVYFRVCFLVKGLKYYFRVIFVNIQLLILGGGVKLISRTAWAVFKYCGTKTVPLRMKKDMKRLSLNLYQKKQTN